MLDQLRRRNITFTNEKKSQNIKVNIFFLVYPSKQCLEVKKVNFSILKNRKSCFQPSVKAFCFYSVFLRPAIFNCVNVFHRNLGSSLDLNIKEV